MAEVINPKKTLNKKDAVKLAEAIKAVKEDKLHNKIKYIKPYGWQEELIEGTKNNNQMLLMAANRVGKTFMSCYILATNLLGDYPPNWKGRKWKRGINAWALGHSSETVKSILQEELVGIDIGNNVYTGGLIPSHRIERVIKSQFPGLLKEVYIKHSSGGISKLGFKQYSAGQAAIMGTSQDFILIDEDPAGSPRGHEIYPQCVVRTMTTAGIVLMAFTPEFGQTQLITDFTHDPKPKQYFQNVTWDDAPHLTEEVKEQLLASLPDYQKEMRSKGIPILGSGQVFPISQDKITVEPFKIPTFYKVCAAIDIGIEHPTTVVWSALNPDTGVHYVFDSLVAVNETPITIAPRINEKGKGIPVIYPHDSDNREKGSGESVSDRYRANNVNMFIKFSNRDGTNFVEPGIMLLNDLFKANLLKIFDDQKELLQELQMYHRRDGKIYKRNDDLMDAMRYSVLSVDRYNCYWKDRFQGKEMPDQAESVYFQ